MKIIKNIFIIVLMMLLVACSTGFGNAVTITQNEKINRQINESFTQYEIEIIPIDKETDDTESASDPYVEITYPEDGSEVYSSYLEILGYATDSDGLYLMEYIHESGSYIKSENETLGGGIYYGFRIRVYNLLPGTHSFTVIFYDAYNNSGSDSVTIYYGENNLPDIPKKPIGPSIGMIDKSYVFTTNTTDPNEDNVKYGWDWDGDNIVDEWTDFYESGKDIDTPHVWNSPGIYNVKVKAQDTKGAKSGFSSSHKIEIIDNTAPTKPATPSGSLQGRPGVSYSYSSYSTDAESHKLYYLFDWDDGTDSGWIGPYNEGDSVSISHIWDAKGTYQVKVKAKDDPNNDGDLSDGMESVWSDSLPVSMPKTKSNIFYQNLLSFLKIMFCHGCSSLYNY